MIDTTKLIAELEGLLADATPREWKMGEMNEQGDVVILHGGILIAEGSRPHNARLIVAMHNYLPELLRYTKIAIEPCLDCDSLQSDLQNAEGFGSDLVGVLLKHFPAAEADPDYPGEDLYSANEFDRVILSALRELEARAEKAEADVQSTADWWKTELADNRENWKRISDRDRTERDEAVKRAKQMQAARDVLAKECAEFQKVIDCDARNQQHDYHYWIEYSDQEAAKREAGEVAHGK